MKKFLCALLTLVLCLSAALAEGENPGEPAADPPAEVSVQEEKREAQPQPEPEPEPKPELKPEPEPKPEPKPEPETKPETEAKGEQAPAPGEDSSQEPGEETPPDADQQPEEKPGGEDAAPEENGGEDEPAEDEPAEDEPAGDEPAGDEPAEDEPAGDEPAEDEPEGDKPAEDEPAEGEAAEGYIDREAPGKLADLLQDASGKTVYVLAKEPVEVGKIQLKLLKNVTFAPAPEVFAEKKYVVALYDGEEPIAPEAIEAATDETVALVIAVEKKRDEETDPTPVDPPQSGGDEQIVIAVDPVNLSKTGDWQGVIPEFRLSGIPKGKEGEYTYQAILYDERYIPLSGDAYLPTKEGEYAVRFAIMNDMDDSISTSKRYEFKLDYTPPELAIEVSTTEDYTMTLSGGDALSGVDALTLDGGETWKTVALDEGLSVVHSESRRKEFKPGMIGLRDLADNVSWNAESIVLDAIPKEEPMDFGGFGGGEPKPTAEPHASGDGDDAPYDAYELALPEGAVDALTLGGEPIDLGLQIADEAAPEIADEPGRFTAELTAWAAEDALWEDEPKPNDTLVIRAETGAISGAYACTWRVNGAVLRKLYNSDISYLALAAGDAMLALPTVGFTAGTRYAELKMQGVSTAEFEYEIVMRVDPAAAEANFAPSGWNLAPDCTVELRVEVAGERFEMIGRDDTPEMYPYDVYCGPADLTDYPYGAYPGMGEEEM